MTVITGPKIPVMSGATLGTGYLAQGNSFLRMLQALVQGNVLSINLNVPPVSPNNGDTYIVGSAPTGAWAGKANQVAYWTLDDLANPLGVWDFYPPKEMWIVGNQADGKFYFFDGANWVVAFTPVSPTVVEYWNQPYLGWVASQQSSTSPIPIGTENGSFNTAGTLTHVELSGGRPSVIRATTTASVGAGLFMKALLSGIAMAAVRRVLWRVKPVSLANTRMWIGVTADTSLSNNFWGTNQPNVGVAAFRFSPSAGDTTWHILCQTSNVLFNLIDTGIVPDTANLHLFEVRYDPTAATVSFWYDGTKLAEFNNNLPPFATATQIATCTTIDNMSTGAFAISLDWYMNFLTTSNGV